MTTVTVGVATPDRLVGVTEMLPNKRLTMKRGDRVVYTWADPDNIHSVFLPTVENDIPPIGFDCGTSYQPINGPPVPCLEAGEPPELIGDPGNAPAGVVLKTPSTLVDSGVLTGTGIGPTLSLHTWSVATRNNATAAGTYSFKCTIHDFMTGTLRVT